MLQELRPATIDLVQKCSFFFFILSAFQGHEYDNNYAVPTRDVHEYLNAQFACQYSLNTLL